MRRPPRSNLRILKISDGDRPGEKYVQLQYSLLDKRTPQVRLMARDKGKERLGAIEGEQWA